MDAAGSQPPPRQPQLPQPRIGLARGRSEQSKQNNKKQKTESWTAANTTRKKNALGQETVICNHCQGSLSATNSTWRKNRSRRQTRRQRARVEVEGG